MEKQRHGHDLRAAENAVKVARSDWTIARSNLTKALALLIDVQTAYRLARGDIRRPFNQTFWSGLFVEFDDDAPEAVKAEATRTRVVRSDVTDGWSQLMADDLLEALESELLPAGQFGTTRENPSQTKNCSPKPRPLS